MDFFFLSTVFYGLDLSSLGRQRDDSDKKKKEKKVFQRERVDHNRVAKGSSSFRSVPFSLDHVYLIPDSDAYVVYF